MADDKSSGSGDSKEQKGKAPAPATNLTDLVDDGTGKKQELDPAQVQEMLKKLGISPQQLPGVSIMHRCGRSYQYMQYG